MTQTQDNYFADINQMLDKANNLILEIAAPEDKLNVVAIIAAFQHDVEDGDIAVPPETSVDGSQDLLNILLGDDMDAQQPVE